MKEKDPDRNAYTMKFVLAAIVAAFVCILIVTLNGVVKDNKVVLPEKEEEILEGEIHKNQQTFIGIVKRIDSEGNLLTLYNIETKEEHILTYSKATVLTNRYDEAITIDKLVCGEIVEAVYEVETNTLVSCDITDQAWEYKKVSNWSMNKSNKTMTVGQQTYQYTNQLYAYSNNELVDINSLSSKDELTVKGINGQVYSIIVTKGHGYLSFTNYEAFQGGTLEVGYDIITKVEENMKLVLREGEYKLTFKKGSVEGVKYIRIQRNQDTIVDMGEYQTELVRSGKVKFDITPNGADLFIDNKEMNYDSEVELEYGEYNIRVVLSGYEEYNAKLTVGQAYETLYITLVGSQVAATTSPETDIVIEDTEEEEDTDSTNTATPSPTSSPSTEEDEESSEVTIDRNHMITISTPVGAEVYINNTYKGTIPLSFEKVIGKDLKLTLKMDGYDSKTYTLDVVDDNENVTWTFNKWW